MIKDIFGALYFAGCEASCKLTKLGWQPRQAATDARPTPPAEGGHLVLRRPFAPASYSPGGNWASQAQ